jgi:hypothetical protein
MFKKEFCVFLTAVAGCILFERKYTDKMPSKNPPAKRQTTMTQFYKKVSKEEPRKVELGDAV